MNIGLPQDMIRISLIEMSDRHRRGQPVGERTSARESKGMKAILYREMTP